MTLDAIITTAQGLGAIGMLTVALIGAMRRWYYFAQEVDDLREDRDEWKAMALKAVGHAEALVEAKR